MAFYPGSELANSPSNWWGPNSSAAVAMLKTVGFKKVDIVTNYRSFFFRFCKAAYYGLKKGFPFVSMLRTDRMVFHGWRE
jgi:hypothetical protein